MPFEQVLVLAARSDEALAFGREYGLPVKFCQGAHNLYGSRLLIELPSFADARQFGVQQRLVYWDQDPSNIHMYVDAETWEHDSSIKLGADGYQMFDGIVSTGSDGPSSRGTNAQRRALAEPRVDEEDETMLALEGGRRTREPETTGKYVVELTPAEIEQRRNAPSQPVEVPQGASQSVVGEDSPLDEARWDDNGGAGRPDPKPAKKAPAKKAVSRSAQKRQQELDDAPVVQPPPEF